jgi:fluoroquinolone transport system permease protein
MILSIVRTDLKNILRDPALLMLCFAPLLMLAVLRFGYPALYAYWPEIATYRNLILALFCIVGSLMPGLAMAFAMLDEKDQDLQVVLQILPVSFPRITFYRVLVIYIFGFLTTLLFLNFSGISHFTILEQLLLAILTSATAPILAMIPAFLASNKIEGTTLSKMLNFLFMLPIPAFLFPGTWSWFMMILPPWWIYFSFENTQHPLIFLAGITGGLIIHAIILMALMRYIFYRIRSLI